MYIANRCPDTIYVTWKQAGGYWYDIHLSIKWNRDICGGLQVVKSKEDTLQTQRRTRRNFRRSNVVSFVVSTGLLAVLGLSTSSSIQHGLNIRTAYAAQTIDICSDSDITRHTREHSEAAVYASKYAVEQAKSDEFPITFTVDHCDQGEHKVLPSSGPQEVRGEQPAKVKTPVSEKGSQVQKKSSGKEKKASGKEKKGTGKKKSERSDSKMKPMKPSSNGVTYNVYPYGQCTWWANQRYRQLHGIFVPWSMNANALQWADRAHDAGWHISQRGKKGAIIVLQPWVQGASGGGHVGVVERVNKDGSVVASSMNWGYDPVEVMEATFRPAPGVAFVSNF